MQYLLNLSSSGTKKWNAHWNVTLWPESLASTASAQFDIGYVRDIGYVLYVIPGDTVYVTLMTLAMYLTSGM